MDASSRSTLAVFVGLVALFTAVGFLAGMAAGGGESPPAAPSSGGDASQEEIRRAAEQYVQQQVLGQRRQLEAAANRSENLTSDDVSLEATVTAVSASNIGSLYRANFTVTGEVPRRLGSGTRSIQQNSSLYVSSDARYIFRRPIDLEQPRRPAQGAAPTGP